MVFIVDRPPQGLVIAVDGLAVYALHHMWRRSIAQGNVFNT
jgi:hypothetical protein